MFANMGRETVEVHTGVSICLTSIQVETTAI